MFQSQASVGALVLVISQLVACGDGGGGAGSAQPSSKPAGSAKPAATATAAKTAEPAKPVELVEIDLSTADPKWAGWIAKGPADAKVLADGVNGARMAAKGPGLMDRKPGGDNGFDVAFAWGKQDLKELKANIQKGADNPIGDTKMTVTFTKDEAGLLEWTSEVGKSKSWNFVMHMNVEKTDISCKNNYMIGAGNEDEHKRQMEACKTLAKKAK